jgi:glucuronate isomerase
MLIKDDTLSTLTNCAAAVKADLTAAQKAFTKAPNSTNWQACLRAMFTHQQIVFAVGSKSVDHNYLAFTLTNNPRAEWQNVISRATTGVDIKDALQEFAVF